MNVRQRRRRTGRRAAAGTTSRGPASARSWSRLSPIAPVARAVADDADLRAPSLDLDDGRRARASAPSRTCAPAGRCCRRSRPAARCTGRVSLWPEPAAEVGGQAVARDRAVRDAVAVDVLVAAPLAQSPAAARPSARLPRSIGFSGYGNGSDIQVFMPRSRSLITKTGVCSRSARSNASIAIS